MEDNGLLIRHHQQDMRTRRNFIMNTAVSASLLIILWFLGCSGGSRSMSGIIVDAETSKPIEGAVVLVEWTRQTGIGDKHTLSAKVVEKVTDRDGKFNIGATLRSFGDSPDVTVYKRGYVGWNSTYIFPDNKHRTDFEWNNSYVFRLERFREGYSHDRHVSFLRRAIKSTIGYEKKKMMMDAFDWETDLGLEEIKLRK